jgi:DNA repair protein RadC
MVKSFLRLHLEQKEREHFSVLFLDTQNRLIDYQVLFMGSIDSANINPREVVKAALQLNARSLIVAHNHPSGDATPSQQDISVTKRLISALELIDVKLLDHMVIGHNEIISLSEEQLM